HPSHIPSGRREAALGEVRGQNSRAQFACGAPVSDQEESIGDAEMLARGLRSGMDGWPWSCLDVIGKEVGIPIQHGFLALPRAGGRSAARAPRLRPPPCAPARRSDRDTRRGRDAPNTESAIARAFPL